ncbi:MAG TPA: spore coat protein [Symbiobacteriaceae bacterium]
MTEKRALSGGQVGRMTDADRLQDCLTSSRERALQYATAALESSNNGVREFFLAMHGEETHNQEVLFHFLHSRGYYPVVEAAPERIRQAAQRYRTMHDSLRLQEPPERRHYHTADPKWPPGRMPEHS